MTIEILYRYVENNTGHEKTGTCTSLSEEGAIAVAVDYLRATKLESGEYIYCDHEINQYYVVDSEEMMSLGAAHYCRSGSDYYSLWADATGREATRTEITEVEDTISVDADGGVAAIKINVYRDGSKWFGARWIDGVYDGCDALEIPDSATTAEAIEAARVLPLSVAGERKITKVDDIDSNYGH